MLIIRCRDCNKELVAHPTQTKCCGCPNMATVKGDKISALDLSRVVIVNSDKDLRKTNVLSSSDLAYQEERRKRKVRKLDFEVR